MDEDQQPHLRQNAIAVNSAIGGFYHEGSFCPGAAPHRLDRDQLEVVLFVGTALPSPT